MDLWLVVELLALTGFSLLAYTLRTLDARGAAASWLLGLIIILAGGIGWLLLMAVFTAIAFVATRFRHEAKERLGLAESSDGERRTANVLGNGGAPLLMALAAFVVPPEAAAIAFATAVAAITADTMASEIGALAPRPRRITPPFPQMVPGANGAVSGLGQFAAGLGAAAVAAAAVPLLGLSWPAAMVAMLGGFAGSQVDSLLGATLERDSLLTERPLSKHDVNFLASLLPSLVVLAALVLF